MPLRTVSFLLLLAIIICATLPIMYLVRQPSTTPSYNHDYTEHSHDSYTLARSQSFGFFYDITEAHWKLLQKIFFEHKNHRYPDKPLTYHPEVKDANEARPEIYKNRNSWTGWFSYRAWYQNVSRSIFVVIK